MPKYKPVAERIAEGLFAAKNRLFELVQRKIDEGKDEKAILKEIKENHTADPAVLSEIENIFFKKRAEIVEDGYTTPLYEVYEKIDAWISSQIELQDKDFSIDDTNLISKLKSYYGFDIEDDANDVLNQYYIEYGGKEQVLSTSIPTKVSQTNPYRPKEADNTAELLKEYDSLMDAATDLYEDSKISIRDFTKIKEAYNDLDDTKFIETYLVALKKAVSEAIASGAKSASWIDDAKVGDQVELNGEIGKVTYTGSDKIEVQTSTKMETVWKN